jgi:hypothetical protein
MARYSIGWAYGERAMSTALRWISVVATGVCLAGCQTAEDRLLARPDNPCTASHMRSHAECRNAFINSVHMGDVRIGQTQDEVQAIMRKGPEQREAGPDSESWLYHTNYRNRLWTRLVFRQGRVAEIKQVDIRRLRR